MTIEMNHDNVARRNGPEVVAAEAIEPRRKRERKCERRSKQPSPTMQLSESGSFVPATSNDPIGRARKVPGSSAVLPFTSATTKQLRKEHYIEPEQHSYHRERRHGSRRGRSSGSNDGNIKRNPPTSRRSLVCIAIVALALYFMSFVTVYRAVTYRLEQSRQRKRLRSTESHDRMKGAKKRTVRNQNQQAEFRKGKNAMDWISAKHHGLDHWNGKDIDEGSRSQPRPHSSRHLPTSKKKVQFRRKYKRLIYFLHIHKAAGSFVCRHAQLNRLSANYRNNCNVRANQRCCGKNGNFSESNQIEYAKKATYDLVANERELPEVLLPEYYDYVVCLRDSRNRYESHWKHLVHIAKKSQSDQKRFPRLKARSSPWTQQSKNLNGDISGTRRWRLHELIEYDSNDPEHYQLSVRNPKDKSLHPVGNYTKWIMGQPDNYNLRMICGTKCLKVRKFQITKDLFEYTLKRLWTDFSHVIFVEDMEESFGAFAKAYNWTKFSKPSSNATSNSTLEKIVPYKPTEDVKIPKWWDPHMTVLDDALYELAKRKYSLATSASKKITMDGNHSKSSRITRPMWNVDYEPFANQGLVDKYFREGPLRNCANSCCGYCTKW